MCKGMKKKRNKDIFFVFFLINRQKKFFFPYFEGKFVIKRIIIDKKVDNRLLIVYEYGKKVIIRI